MRKIFTILLLSVASLSVNAQLGTAPDFTVIDIDGNEINLYDILDQGIIAIVDVSATWCAPCWSLHQSHVLQELHELYGPDGSNQIRVMYYEGDAGTTLADVQGTGNNTLGDWTEGITYPIINESPISLNLNIYAPQGFPTVNVIRPSDAEIVADPWNVFSLAQQVSIIENGTGIDLVEATGVEEFRASENITVFPNPTAGIATINLTDIEGAVNISVIDVLGKVVSSYVSNEKLATVDFSDFEDGNYMIRISNENIDVTKRLSVIK